MNKAQFTQQSWNEYLYWQMQDRKTLRKINELITDIMRNGAMEGIGNPEPLKGELTGYFSRSINKEDRLVYRILEGDIVEIYSCIGHYEE